MIPRTYPLAMNQKTSIEAEVRPDDTSRAARDARTVTTFFRAPSFQISVKGATLCVRVRASTAPDARRVG